MKSFTITLDKEDVAAALRSKAQELTAVVTDEWDAHVKIRHGGASVTFTQPEAKDEDDNRVGADESGGEGSTDES